MSISRVTSASDRLKTFDLLEQTRELLGRGEWDLAFKRLFQEKLQQKEVTRVVERLSPSEFVEVVASSILSQK